MSDSLLDPMTQRAMQGDQQATLRGFTQPFKFRKADQPVFYRLALKDVCMHREDGKKISFIQNIFQAIDLNDIAYLNNQIDESHPHLRLATEEEIQQYKMLTDPRGTIEAEIRPQIEDEIRAKLEAEIRAEMELKQPTGIEGENTTASSWGRTGIRDEDKLAETTNDYKLKPGGVDVGNATFVPSAPPPATTLQGIQSTSDIKTAAATSGT
jgi:hypothetical protein